MEPISSDQLQGKRNARSWKRQFKVAALGKGVWDVFNGIYSAVACPDPKDYGLQNAQQDATEVSSSHTDDEKSKIEDGKGKRKARATLGPDEIQDFIRKSAETAVEQKRGLDFKSRMTLYKFTLEEYDKGRKTIATAMALLIVWVHPSLRGQLETFTDPKEAFDHLLSRYSVTDARAREMAENLFNGIYVTRFISAQNYINAIENAQQDILEAGGYCDSTMMISKIIRGLRGHPMYKDFATQYHLLRDIDDKFNDLDHVITQLLTFESSNLPEPDFRSYGASQDFRSYGSNQYETRRVFGPRNAKQQPRTKCSGCNIWGHNETECMKTHPELRPQNKGPPNPNGRNANNNYKSQTRNGYSGSGRDIKPNYMAAAAFIDEEAFLNALHGASMDNNSTNGNVDTNTHLAANTMSTDTTLQGIAPMTLPVHALAKTPDQATSLGGVRGEAGRGHGVMDLEGESSLVFSAQRQSVPAGVCLIDNCTTVTTEDTQGPNMRNTNGIFKTHSNLCDATQFPIQEVWATNNETTWDELMLKELNALNNLFEGEHQVTDTDTTKYNTFYDVENIMLKELSPLNNLFEEEQDVADASTSKSNTFYDVEDIAHAFLHAPYHQNLETSEASFDYDETLCGDYTNVCMTACDSPVQPNAWILDSGANVYICNNASLFTELHTFNTKVGTANVGSVMPINGGGSVTLILEDGDGDPFTLVLNDVAYSPTSRCNLLSISKLAKAGILGSWNTGGVCMSLRSAENFTIGKADLRNGLYHLKLHPSMTLGRLDEPFVANVDFTDTVWKEHRRLGHLSLQRMLQLCSHSKGMKVTQEEIRAKIGQICPICATTRAIVRIPKDPARVRHQEKGKLVHVNIWGPYPVIGWDKTRWMCFITDDATRTTKVLRLKKLTDFPQLLRDFHKNEERHYQITILSYRVDNQFNQGPWKDWCTKKGITIEPIAPHAHHQVGVAERVNRTLREGASAMIQDNAIGRQIRKIIQEQGNEFLRNSTLPETLWPEAMDYAAWLKNRSPTRAHKSKKTPWEIEEGLIPDLTNEKTWGSRVYVSYTDEEKGRKLHDPRSWLGYFVGCENESAYRVWDPESKRVRRVAYSVVDDGQGLDDTHDGDNINNRVTWDQGENIDSNTGSSDSGNSDGENAEFNDDELNESPESQGETVSKFFQRPTAMVTTRSGPRKQNETEGDPVITPPRSARVHDHGQVRPKVHQGPSRSQTYEDTYVPRIVDTLTASPFFRPRDTREESPESDNDQEEAEEEDIEQENDEDEFHSTLSVEQEEDPEEPVEEAISQENDEHNESRKPSKNHDDSDSWVPPFPQRSDNKRTPNQLAILSDSESEPVLRTRRRPRTSNNNRTANQSMAESDSEPEAVVKVGRRWDRKCANDWCTTPKSYVAPGNIGPDGVPLCYACWGRYKRNPNTWQDGVNRVPRTCSNDMCGTPNAFVGPDVDSEGKSLCINCHQRYRIYQTSDKTRGPDGWKDPQGYRNRGRKQHAETKINSSDSDNGELTSRFPESQRGARDRKSIPDREKCQACFDSSLNCTKNPCVQCTTYRHDCIPLKLNADGSLPTKRLASKAKVQDEGKLLYQNRCHMCQQKHRLCDATLPIDPKKPCTPCKENNNYCVSEEQWKQNKSTSPCLRCGNTGKTTRCDRKEPCNMCIEDSHARCTYQSQDGTRWRTTLTNPIDPAQKASKTDANADYYDPEIPPSCIACQTDEKKRVRKGNPTKSCSFTPGGPPCDMCFNKANTQATNRCTNWVAPGKIEAVATRMFKRDETSGNLIRDEAATKNESTKKSTQKRKKDTMSDSSGSDFETAHARIYTEESRAKAREKLMSIKLPEAFLTAMSLTAISSPVDDALRPDPQSYLEAMRSADRQK